MQTSVIRSFRWCTLVWVAATLHPAAATAQTTLASSHVPQNQQPALQGQQVVTMQ
ncbi:MAG: hypothetical protein H7Z75_04910, partial [Ferruginibacter sp.]|nr:hypothetical protein [Cytophagales bacterium]